MRYIAHRGNTHGVDRSRENSPDYIMDALKMGYECEVDVRFENSTWFLGHDEAQYPIVFDFLFTPGLWIHCKNMEALTRLIYTNLNVFWHQEDDYTITTHKYIWCYPGKYVDIPNNAICVKPEVENTDWTLFSGVCSDYVGYYHDQASTI